MILWTAAAVIVIGLVFVLRIEARRLLWLRAAANQRLGQGFADFCQDDRIARCRPEVQSAVYEAVGQLSGLTQNAIALRPDDRLCRDLFLTQEDVSVQLQLQLSRHLQLQDPDAAIRLRTHSAPIVTVADLAQFFNQLS